MSGGSTTWVSVSMIGMELRAALIRSLLLEAW
jgi:hypothetical protein